MKAMGHNSIISRGLAGLIVLAALAIGLAAPSVQAGSVVDTRHNLSASGPGPVRAVSEDRICVFCHTPHGASGEAPLWNRRQSTATYIPYNSPTLKSQPGQPTGASKLCLSCHDGTVALGDVISAKSGSINMTRPMRQRGGLIGTDLRDDHPISFNYFSALSKAGGSLTPPSAWDDRMKLDKNSELQCTTCHNPHDDQWGRFLVMDNQGARMCQECHMQQGFTSTRHALSGKTWSGAGPNPWAQTQYKSVAANGCMNCHLPHHAEGQELLLTSAVEEEVCFNCHNGNVASFNLEAVFQKASVHPLDMAQGEHEPSERALINGSHVECADCHNPHRAKSGAAVAPFIKGSQIGVTGIDASGHQVDEAAYEYEICFKCHSRDTVSGAFGGIVRQIPSSNRRKQFSPSSPSFHPVETVGMNKDVPSLISPWTEASLVYCTDCHNNNNPQPGAKGSSGPHGSDNEFLLSARYVTGSDVQEAPRTAYALCFKCHSSASILANEGFAKHQGHIERVKTSCSVCHEGHGIDYTRGNATNNAHLINFDTSVVKPLNGLLEYESTGPRKGNCTLMCHGFAHDGLSY